MRPVAVVSLAVLLAACATITKGTTQVVAVNTPGVNGASCTLTSPAIGSLMVSGHGYVMSWAWLEADSVGEGGVVAAPGVVGMS